MGQAIENKRRRCPGLEIPMQTGDGLLARTGSEALPLSSWRELCTTASRCGNELLEITSRGCVQIRGLREETWDRFTTKIRRCGFRSPLAPVLHQNLDLVALADPTSRCAEWLTRLTALLERVRAQRAFHPKFSLSVDVGVGPGFDLLPTDLRLRSMGTSEGRDLSWFELRSAGELAASARLGVVDLQELDDRLPAALLERAGFGPEARPSGTPAADPGSELPEAVRLGPIRFESPHLARALDGCGVGLAASPLHADTLLELLAAAARDGALLLKPYPKHTLWFFRQAATAAEPSGDAWANLLARAASLGLATTTDAPILRLSACVGAPHCASAEFDTQNLLAHLLCARQRAGSCDLPVHIAGCAKRCGRPQGTRVEITGTSAGCEIHLDGRSARRALSPAAVERELSELLDALDPEADAHA